MTRDLATGAARLKLDQATGHVDLTGDTIRRVAEAHGLIPDELQRAVVDAVLYEGDGGGPTTETRAMNRDQRVIPAELPCDITPWGWLCLGVLIAVAVGGVALVVAVVSVVTSGTSPA